MGKLQLMKNLEKY